MPDDLWPSNFADANFTTPATILKQQAALLGEKTKQLVTGQVVPQTTGNLFVHSFYIAAPTLGYKYELFQVHHGINFYPLTFKYLNTSSQLRSEAELKDKLKEIFASEHTLNVVHSILAQVRS
jgi:hypothetical protein